MLRLASRVALAAVLTAAALHLAGPLLDRARGLPGPLGSAADELRRLGDAITSRDDGSPVGRCHARGPMPDRRCTPGVALTGLRLSVICRYGYTTHVRNVPADVTRGVYRRYGIGAHAPDAFEVDHLIPLAIGGSNDPRNLWPQAAPGYKRKDRVEAQLAKAVCARGVSIAAAQRAIASDWTTTLERLGLTR